MPVLDLGGVVGCQEPTVATWPEYDTSRGREVVELAGSAGLVLDPWEELCLEHGLGVRPDGQWASFEVGANVPRQNGKGAILEALELGCLFIFEDPLTVHSAHLFDTSLEHLGRMEMLLGGREDLSRQVKRVVRTHGQEGIELLNGRRLRFRTRTAGGGRGLSGNKLILDEAMFLPETMVGALVPIVSAQRAPQIWYMGSAVDWTVHKDGLAFARVRSRGHEGDPRLAWFEWSADPAGDPDNTEDFETDRGAWARANPALGIRIAAEHIAAEQRSMAPRTFAVERLGIGDWPDPDSAHAALDLEKWAALEDKGSQPAGAVCFAADIAPDRSSGAIAIASRRRDGLYHLEVARHLRGTGWMVAELKRMLETHANVGLVLDGAGPGASLMGDLDAQGVEYRTVNAREHGAACGLLYDSVEQARVRHLSQRELTGAIKGSARRALGDAWAWSRKSSSIDISPLVACTLALWGSVEAGTAEGGFEW